MREQTDIVRLKRTLREQLPLLAELYQIESLGVFGSYVRHEQRGDSDLDLLVSFRAIPSLLRFIELQTNRTVKFAAFTSMNLG